MAEPRLVPRRLRNGRIEIQLRAEGPGGMIGDGVVTIGPDHPDYQDTLDYIRRRARVIAAHRRRARRPVG